MLLPSGPLCTSLSLLQVPDRFSGTIPGFLTRFLHYFRFIFVVYIIPICYNAENKNRLLFSHEWICWPSRKGGREALTYLLVSGRENKTAEGRKRFSGGLILFYIIEKKRKKSALPDLADPGRGGFGR
jgi:hypothetical protein